MASICTALTCKHRKLLLQVLQRLSFEDTASLIYLSGNIVGLPVDSSRAMLQGIKLFAELEGRGMLGDGNYTFVAECLEAIGRNDLAAMIAESTAHSLSCVPPSFQASGQMVLMKQAVFKSKYNQFRTQMRHLAARSSNHKLCEKGFEELCSVVHSGCLSVLKNLDHSSQTSTIALDLNIHLVPVALKSGLTELSFFWKAMPNALTILNRTGSIEQALPFMQQCHSHFSRFEQILPNSPWLSSTSQQQLVSSFSYFPDGGELESLWSATHGARVFFADALSAVACNQEMSDSSKRLEQTICILESMTIKTICSRSRLFASWMITLLQHPQAREMDEIDEIKDLIVFLIQEHKQEMSKYPACEVLAKIVGMELLQRAGVALPNQTDEARFSSVEHTNNSSSSHPNPSESTASKLLLTDCGSLLWHVTLLVLFGFVAKVPFNQGFTEQLQAIIKDYFFHHRHQFQENYTHHSEAVGALVKEVFRKSKQQAIEHLLKDIRDENATIRQTMHQLLDYEEDLKLMSSDLSQMLCNDKK